MKENIRLINKFVEYLAKHNKSTFTIIAYKKDISQLSEYKKVNFVKYKSQDIKDFLKYLETDLRYSKKTISRKLNSINTFFKFLNSSKYIKTNPSEEVQHPRFRTKSIRVLKKNEINSLRDVSLGNTKLCLMTELIIQTGLRISELSELKLKNIDLKNKEIILSKAESTTPRSIPLNNKIYLLIKDYLSLINSSSTNIYFLRTKTNNKIQIRNLRNVLDKAILKAKIKNACVNDLRNTFIVEQLNAGLSIEIVSKVSGHRNLNSTKRYLSYLRKKYKTTNLTSLVEI